MADSTYILLPRRGVVARQGGAAEVALASLPVVASTGPAVTAVLAGGVPVRIFDTTRENGPKLVEIDDDAARDLNATQGPVRALPLVVYRRPEPVGLAFEGSADGLTATYPVPGPGGVPLAVPAAGGAVQLTVTVTDANTGQPVPGVVAAAILNGQVSRATTDAGGVAVIGVSAAGSAALHCIPPVTAGYWGAYRASVAVPGPIAVSLTPVDLTFIDAVRFYYGNSRFNPGTGVVVGVLDTGVGPHLDLNVAGGRNTVTGEPATDFQDGHYHGTHVAGLVGASGGLRGLAPGIPVRSYRVFAQGGAGATNYAILKAMILAGIDGCDIINLSLGGGPYDTVVDEAIEDARHQGMLVVIAAGNDHRQVVSYPAAYRAATAVSALERETTFPPGSSPEANVLRPPHSTGDPLEFLADFSNVGPQIAITGPGVGVLSTLPNNHYGPLSGTSMAAPVVAGAAACLLSQNPLIHQMTRYAQRSAAISACCKRAVSGAASG